MKIRHLLPALALCSPLAALAVPAYPGLVKQLNPDGTTVEIRIHGDEHFSYITDAKCNWIMEQNAAGQWVVAERGGVKMEATADNINLLRDAQASDFSRANTPGMKYAELSAEDGRSKFPCTGSGKYLIVLMQYSDTKFSMENPQAYYTDWFNKENFVDGDIKLSARDYYKKVSTGKFTPQFVVSPVVTLPNTSKYYVGSNGKYSLFSTAIRHALSRLVEQNFDFTPFDLDHDGVIDNIYFIYAGYGQADTGDQTTIWPHASSFSGYYGGLQAGRYACSNELRGSHYYKKDGTKTGIGTFCHEFGHVLGLPDMYDPNYDAECSRLCPGDWSIMCNGSYLGDGCVPASYASYDRWACRWMEFTDIKDEQTYELAPLTDEAKAYRMVVPTSSSYSEYYVFENRTKQDIDSYIPGNGMLIWHVDFNYDVWRMNRVNSDATHMRLTVMPPTGKTIANANWPGIGAFDNLIYKGMPNEFTSFNTPNKAWTPGVFNIKYDTNTKKASFDYNENPQVYSELPIGVTYGRKAENDETGFKIGWNAPAGATGYVVTIQRRNSSGNLYTVDGYTDRIVNTNEITVNESAAMMKQDTYFTVRAVGPTMPSSKTYTSDWFVPMNLPVYTGLSVNNIFDDADLDITVSNGTITAPAGARVFNMSGIETGTENLPAGIYVVRCGNKAVKVVVR